MPAQRWTSRCQNRFRKRTPCDAPNLIITPYAAGFWHFHLTLGRVVALATENLGRFARGEGLRNLVRG